MKVWKKITLSLCLIFLSLILFSLLKTFRISPTGQFILTIGSSISLLTGIGIALPIIYKFVQGAISTATERKRRKLVVALDTNVLINAFLYRHPEYTKEPVGLLKDDYEVLRLVRSGEVVGFVPYGCMEEARNVLYRKYRMHPDMIGEFIQDITNAGVTFSLKRPQRWDEQTIKHISSSRYVHNDDSKLTEYALRNYCDAIITDDHRFVKNSTILHYLPILYTRDFLSAFNSGYRTKKELEKVAYQKFKEHEL